MRLKYLFLIFILSLVLFPTGFAAEDTSGVVSEDDSNVLGTGQDAPSKVDLGTWQLHGQEREITDLIVFLLILFIFVVVVFEIITFVGFVDKKWMRWTISALVVFLMNSNQFLFNTFYALQDFKLIVEKVTSLTPQQVFWWVLGILIFAVILLLLRDFLKRFKKNISHSAEDELDGQFEQKMEAKKKINKIKAS